MCRVHGGAAPQVRKAAQERLELMAEQAVLHLAHFAFDDDVPAYVALQAVTAILDRAGVIPKTQVAVEVTDAPWADLANQLIDVARAPRNALQGKIIEGEIVETPSSSVVGTEAPPAPSTAEQPTPAPEQAPVVPQPPLIAVA